MQTYRDYTVTPGSIGDAIGSVLTQCEESKST